MSTFVYKTVSSTEDNTKKTSKKEKDNKTLTFSSPFNSAENWFLGKPANPQHTSD